MRGSAWVQQQHEKGYHRMRALPNFRIRHFWLLGPP